MGDIAAVPGRSRDHTTFARRPIPRTSPIRSMSHGPRSPASRTLPHLLVVSSSERGARDAGRRLGGPFRRSDPLCRRRRGSRPETDEGDQAPSQRSGLRARPVVRDLRRGRSRSSASATRVGAEDPVENAIEFAKFTSGSFGWNINDPGHGFAIADDRLAARRRRRPRPWPAAAAAPARSCSPTIRPPCRRPCRASSAIPSRATRTTRPGPSSTTSGSSATARRSRCPSRCRSTS